jgi:hypothetical protein
VHDVRNSTHRDLTAILLTEYSVYIHCKERSFKKKSTLILQEIKNSETYMKVSSNLCMPRLLLSYKQKVVIVFFLGTMGSAFSRLEVKTSEERLHVQSIKF